MVLAMILVETLGYDFIFKNVILHLSTIVLVHSHNSLKRMLTYSDIISDFMYSRTHPDKRGYPIRL